MENATEITKLNIKVIKIRDELQKRKKENIKLKHENEMLRNNMTVEERIEYLDKRRKTNITVSALDIDTNEAAALKEVMKNCMQKKLEVVIQIKAVFKLGQKVCIIEFENCYTQFNKLTIMSNKHKL